ncbi:MAG: PhoH family protein [Deltaproteobacteria bacterium]|nr:PhoH family protein [Deltaproteobacteria bacterium]MDH3773237.1 PhoH family protein [Deltaproteobacteria bacterium]MDH3801337.1 PhoH family protein [Deltaproteobacteria bacterium]MDH3896675.1 PhoH family protein [Deltaproteobacteria bacterium]MDH3927161.1 PhoH family protein [Deltaproteobacteria bacterium]
MSVTVHVSSHGPGEVVLTFDDNNLLLNLCGERNANLKLIEEALQAKLNLRGDRITLIGEESEVKLAQRVLEELYGLLSEGYPLYPSDVNHAIQILSGNFKARLRDIFLDSVYVTSKKRVITPKSLAQKEYIDAIRTYDIVFGIGPAGTGKTYLAMATAVAALNAGEITRVILVRPAVEAGEKLGFLPGDLVEKVNPYVRPLYDALHDMIDFEQTSTLLQRGVIEVAPLAFMRGRTLNDCFVILDEAQNTTREQMKMFLTRLGISSKAVITGDITQIDLPNGTRSGLIETVEILTDVEGLKFVYFTDKDVIRHRLVQDIIKAYERAERKK